MHFEGFLILYVDKYNTTKKKDRRENHLSDIVTFNLTFQDHSRTNLIVQLDSYVLLNPVHVLHGGVSNFAFVCGSVGLFVCMSMCLLTKYHPGVCVCVCGGEGGVC